MNGEMDYSYICSLGATRRIGAEKLICSHVCAMEATTVRGKQNQGS